MADLDIKITGTAGNYIKAACPVCQETMQVEGVVRWRVLAAALEQFALAHWRCLNPTLADELES